MISRSTILKQMLNGLMRRYQERVPDVQAILNAMISEEIITRPEDIENDHIAFRTLGVANLGIKSIEKIFLHLGYEKRDSYDFPEKKLNAYWYSPPDESLPRIFISELRVNDLSETAQQIIRKYTNQIGADPVDSLDLNSPDALDDFMHSGLWPVPTWSEYSQLRDESEYAAWVIYNRYYLNHFTISIHHLKEGYNTIPLFNAFLEKNGFTLNDAGGKIKTSVDGLLHQSATVAHMIDAEFSEGQVHLIPGSYVEFAERKILAAFEGMVNINSNRIYRREGFEAANANRIFESTYRSQTETIIKTPT